LGDTQAASGCAGLRREMGSRADAWGPMFGAGVVASRARASGTSREVAAIVRPLAVALPIAAVPALDIKAARRRIRCLGFANSIRLRRTKRWAQRANGGEASTNTVTNVR
jgi:hypothetical protein